MSHPSLFPTKEIGSLAAYLRGKSTDLKETLFDVHVVQGYVITSVVGQSGSPSVTAAPSKEEQLAALELLTRSLGGAPTNHVVTAPSTKEEQAVAVESLARGMSGIRLLPPSWLMPLVHNTICEIYGELTKMVEPGPGPGPGPDVVH